VPDVPRVLVDSSTIIALSKIGELDLLRKLFNEVRITPAVRDEILVEGYPETETIREAVGVWIVVAPAGEGKPHGYGIYGIDRGEASLIEVSRPSDRLILDNPVAREVARVYGLDFTGLIGLLVEACDSGLVSRERGRRIIRRLSNSDFRISSELYDWAMKRIED
jgi:predicted nucleic acid-binding protein